MNGTLRRVAVAAAVAALALALGACQGSTSGANGAPRAQAAGAGAGNSGGPTVADAATTPTTPAPSGGGGDICAVIRTYRQRLTDLEAQGLGDPSRLHQFVDDVMAALNQAVRIAPADVRADLTLIRDATASYATLLANAGYDATKLPRGGDNPLLHADVVAANQRQGVYATQTCGIDD